MLKEQAQLFSKLMMISDLLIVGCALFISISFYLADISTVHRFNSGAEYFSYVFAAFVWVACLRYYDGYHSNRRTPYSKLIIQIIKSVITATLIFSMGLFTFNSKIFNSKFVLLVFLITLTALLLERILLTIFLRKIRKRGYNYRQVLIAGSGKRARNFAKLLESHKEWGIRCIGFVDDLKKKVGEIDGKPFMGALDDLEEVLDNHVVDEVVFCLPRNWISKLEKYVVLCEHVGVNVFITLDFFNINIARSRLSKLGGLPILCLESIPSHPFQLMLKRGMDIAISLLFLIILSPLFLMATIIIKLNSKGSVFFGQERCGQNGRKFTMWKFRTMVPNADQLKSDLVHLNEESGPVFKIKDDPRLIPKGKLLRKFSIDELPQLLNVLKGEMSIVGPRPPVPREVENYDRWQRRRLSLRPGLTCLWQVTARNKVSFEDWVRLDLEYIDNWSLGLDIKIIFMTIPAILRGTGV